MTHQAIQPCDGTTPQTFLEATAADLGLAPGTAHRCFEVGHRTPFAAQTRFAHSATSSVRERIDEFARAVTLEMGEGIDELRGEVRLSADILDCYAEHAERFLATVLRDSISGEARVERALFSVLGSVHVGVQSWNFPDSLLPRFAAPNVMAGNVVMVDHAACAPQCAVAFAKLWLEAGALDGAYTNLLIPADQVNQVIDDPSIQGVAPNVSVAAERLVAARAGQNLKQSSMELGGSDSLIVLADADLEQTVKWAVRGKMSNTGQSCVAAQRMIVVESLADRSLAEFKTARSALEPSDPMDPATTLGPLSTEAAQVHLLEQDCRAVARGAELAVGGERIDRRGSFVQPTIQSDIAPDHRAFRDEFFGPVASSFRVKDEDVAVAVANDSDFGFGGVDTRMMFANHATWKTPDLSFGGIKNSGYGRELSSLGIQEFLNKTYVPVAIRSRHRRELGRRCKRGRNSVSAPPRRKMRLAPFVSGEHLLAACFTQRELQRS